MGQLFKNAVMGGFQKQEVIDYIEKQRVTSETEVNNLKAAALRMKKDMSTKDELLKQKQAELDALNTKISELETQNQNDTKKLEEFQLSEATARAETARIKEKYSELKEYIADIELSAYKRAREVQMQAEEQVEEVQSSIKNVHELMTPVAEQAHNRAKMAEEAFSGFKEKIAAITSEMDELVSTISEIADTSDKIKAEKPKSSLNGAINASNSLKSLQDILERVRHNGK